MDFLGDVIGVVASGGFGAIFGGITGLVGTWLKSKHERDMLKIKLEEKQKDREHDLAVMKMEGENAIAVAEIQRQEADDVASAAALQASYKMEPKRYAEGMTFPDNWYGRILKALVTFLMFCLDFFRGVMRPGLTLYMAVLNSLIYWEYQRLIETYAIQPTPEQSYAIMMYFASSFSYLFTTAFVWWFGDRNRQQPPKGMLK